MRGTNYRKKTNESVSLPAAASHLCLDDITLVFAFSNLSAEAIQKMNPVELGSGGLCFLVAEILADRFPDSVLCRLTCQDRKRYAHVFVSVKSVPVDIKGFRNVDKMRFDYDDTSLVLEPIDEASVRQFFYPHYAERQLLNARIALESYIKSHPDVF